MRYITILVAALAVSGCGPSCEEQGGKREFSHYHYSPMYINGRFHGFTFTPIYKCVLPELPVKEEAPKVKDNWRLACW